jgi:uncharacterized delta-60 repeat protein
MALQSDGRILICGTFTNVHDTLRNGIARLHPDGRLDETFDPGNSIGAGAVQSIAWQTNGQVLIAGTFTNVNGISRHGIARLNADGSHDAGFDPGTGALPPAANTVLLQSDGAVLIGGQFTSVNGAARRGFARLHSDGSLDLEFNPSVTVAFDGLILPRVLAVQPDGRIWITGSFGGGTNLVRLLPNGSADVLRYLPYFGVASPISLALQADGKALVSSRVSPLVRLKPDGSMDPTFVVLTFLSPAFVWRGPQFIALQSDGRIVVAGDFVMVNGGSGQTLPGFARLYGGELPFVPPAFVSGSLLHVAGGSTQFRFTGYPGTRVVTESANSLEQPNWTPLKTNTVGIDTIPVVDTNSTSLSQHFYRLLSTGP